ncbi:unnamed protein product [Linum trigynum]|uniref:Uncharacterized protein n=1 Tax=Linum trigynum TaxID=586398 RepID=A0AAV2E710_9ROSI
MWRPNGLQLPVLPLDKDGDDIPCASVVAFASSLGELGAIFLSTADPFAQSKLSHRAFSRWADEGLPIGCRTPPDRPARPPQTFST